MVQPQSLLLSEQFPYKEELISALQNGEPCRRMDEGDFLAGRLAGTYQIRLRIAKDAAVRGHLISDYDLAVRDLTILADRLLSAAPEAVLAVYSVGPTKDGFKYHLFEKKCDGHFVGCLRSPYPDEG
ncbi:MULTISPECIES: hypothetical protein [Stenotrophomonas]|uniref:hypothetical protein n=1 Tax=Stenotrophomonas TaxID=40323 RepID=UPI0012E3B429|nr:MULTISPECIES: hypothetical protein [Stenotrophomonas]